MCNTRALGVLVILMVLGAPSAQAQVEPVGVDPMIDALQDGNGYVRDMFMKAADQMSEEDYAFRPTPEVRSFGQLLAHVAGSNYFFCSTAISERAPVSDVEETMTTREEILEVLSNSFDYCEAAYAAVDVNADTRIEFMGKQRSPMAVLTFRNYHALLHYGNVITYMRLRGKVPPSSQLAPSN